MLRIVRDGTVFTRAATYGAPPLVCNRAAGADVGRSPEPLSGVILRAETGRKRTAMHDIMRERIWRKLQALPEAQLYQVLDYIEFLESKYAPGRAARPDSLQRFAERLEDGMRIRSVAPKVISGTVGLFGTARSIMRTVGDAGAALLGEQPDPGKRPPKDVTRPATTPPPGAEPSGS